MGSLLKDVYSVSFYNTLGKVFKAVVPSFKTDLLKQHIYTPAFETMELKQRMRHTSVVLHGLLPKDYRQQVEAIKNAIVFIRENGIHENGLAFMFLPDFIEVYGLDDYEISVDALEFITQFVSCEFAVRPFLIKYGERFLKQMIKWSKHKSAAVRRLASEGSRPRLPWAMAVPFIKQSPEKVLPILEQLKNDPSDSVRRSVANSLNDIAKDRPEIVLEIAKKWKGISKETDAVIKHGSRTLLKKGHGDILKHFGLDSTHIHLSNFNLKSPKVKIGGDLSFDFNISNSDVSLQKVRLEYAIFYRQKNGNLSKKVFKISERDYAANASENIRKVHRFVLITTRTFYVGEHQLSVIVNGEEKAITTFELVD